ncbi:MAG: hypothetical protein WA364_26515, partial [Candidatus Nitrosopolaris sp.]
MEFQRGAWFTIWMSIFPPIALSLAISLFILSSHSIHMVFADASSFSRVEISNLPNHWHLNPPSGKFNSYYEFTSDGRPLVHRVQPINATECKTAKNHKIDFPIPHITSVSYSGDRKNLNSTLWLSGPSQPLPRNDSNLSQALYRVEVSPSTSNLSDSTKLEISFLRHALKNFRPISIANTTFRAAIPAAQIVYEFSGKTYQDICLNCKAMRYLVLKDKFLYTISYIAEDKKYSGELPYILQKLIKHTEIGKVTSKKDQTYENRIFKIKTEVPNGWIVNNSNPFPNSQLVHIVSFVSHSASDYPTTFTISVDPYPGEDPTLKSYLTKVANGAQRQFANESLRISENNTNTTLLGSNAYKLIYIHQVHFPRH